MRFQSTPDLKAGRYQNDGTQMLALYKFQSTPDLKAGRYHPDADLRRILQVSIHARPEGRAIRGEWQLDQLVVTVSIHARPEGRAIHRRAGAMLCLRSRRYCFNPRPT